MPRRQGTVDTGGVRRRSAREVEQFLSDLAVRRRVAVATQNQALAALLSLYREVLGLPILVPEHAVRATQATQVPAVLSRDEA